MSIFSLSPSRVAISRPAGITLLRRITDAVALHRSRQHLRALDARLLEDIGVSRNQAQNEAERAIWDAPDHWTK